MSFDLLLKNRNVTRLVIGVPYGHQQLRARIETGAGDVITLGEATLSALVRAYTQISMHPQRQAIELKASTAAAVKAGFAEHQLLETDTAEVALRSELGAPPPRPGESSEVPTSVDLRSVRRQQATEGPLQLGGGAVAVEAGPEE